MTEEKKEPIDEKLYEYCSEQMDMMLEDLDKHGKLISSGSEKTVQIDRTLLTNKCSCDSVSANSKPPEPIRCGFECPICSYKGFTIAKPRENESEIYNNGYIAGYNQAEKDKVSEFVEKLRNPYLNRFDIADEYEDKLK